ncbi:MAG: hypothetical protein V1862_02110 [Methanobacteriota archaeon]
MTSDARTETRSITAGAVLVRSSAKRSAELSLPTSQRYRDGQMQPGIIQVLEHNLSM